MQFKKIILSDVEKCYATSGLVINSEPYLIYAGEGQGSLQVYSGTNFEHCQKIWEGGGGTMSIVPLKNYSGWFLASRGFYSMIDAKGSTIEIVRYQNGLFSHKKIATLPNLHRFDVLYAPDGTTYILAATISRNKASKDDWSQPGQLFYSVLPQNLDEDFYLEMTALPGNYTINHGYCNGSYAGRDAGFVGCLEGIFAIIPPEYRTGLWEITCLAKIPVSDIAVIDIDEDGEDEIAAIMPFHGDQYKIFKRYDSDYCEVYKYPVLHDFYHVVVGAIIGNRPIFIGGGRRHAMQLFGITWNNGKKQFSPIVFDEGVGPSNAYVLRTEKYDYLLSANRQIGQAAVYILDN